MTVCAALCAVLLVASTPVTLAMPGLNLVKLEQGEGELYAELLGQKLGELGLKVISARDVAARVRRTP